jgi:hypothetical protein
LFLNEKPFGRASWIRGRYRALRRDSNTDDLENGPVRRVVPTLARDKSARKHEALSNLVIFHSFFHRCGKLWEETKLVGDQISHEEDSRSEERSKKGCRL